jgi:hypothetical protein
MEMFRGDYRPQRWTRSVWARFVLAFTPLVIGRACVRADTLNQARADRQICAAK